MLYEVKAGFGQEVALEVAQVERTRYQLILKGKYNKEFKDMIREKLAALEETLKKHGIE
jgi:hypothetical protein